MSWKRVREFVDHQTGMHVMHLENPVTKATHKLQIWIGMDSCPGCGHVMPKTNTGEIDPRAHEAAELAALDQVHDNIDAYARKHRVPVHRPALMGPPEVQRLR
jgi:hypothetical protein